MYCFFSGDEAGTEGSRGIRSHVSGLYVWPRWVIGEGVGELQLKNVNGRKYIVEAGFSPVETCLVHFLYFKHQLDEKYVPFGAFNPFGLNVDSNNWADEFNLFMDWQVTPNVFWHLGTGYTNPNKAAEECTGRTRCLFGQTWIGFYL